MTRLLAFCLLVLCLAAPGALADDRLSSGEMRKAVLGDWSGRWKSTSLSLSIRGDGSVKGRYAGIPARGSWAVKRRGSGDEFCLTFRSILGSDTKCGELFRQGHGVIYGYLKRGKPRLWLKRG
ncbi:hypothetical protein [Taklimakanibacter lacteus]|uniref:hypothetical protein n=1 Tax=Taklimakanibacter lacteus TaxID=2268456 RepID=UPI000E660A58